jgi:hypothetical protein
MPGHRRVQDYRASFENSPRPARVTRSLARGRLASTRATRSWSTSRPPATRRRPSTPDVGHVGGLAAVGDLLAWVVDVGQAWAIPTHPDEVGALARLQRPVRL